MFAFIIPNVLSRALPKAASRLDKSGKEVRISDTESNEVSSLVLCSNSSRDDFSFVLISSKLRASTPSSSFCEILVGLVKSPLAILSEALVSSLMRLVTSRVVIPTNSRATVINPAPKRSRFRRSSLTGVRASSSVCLITDFW